MRGKEDEGRGDGKGYPVSDNIIINYVYYRYWIMALIPLAGNAEGI